MGGNDVGATTNHHAVGERDADGRGRTTAADGRGREEMKGKEGKEGRFVVGKGTRYPRRFFSSSR